MCMRVLLKTYFVENVFKLCTVTYAWFNHKCKNERIICCEDKRRFQWIPNRLTAANPLNTVKKKRVV